MKALGFVLAVLACLTFPIIAQLLAIKSMSPKTQIIVTEKESR